MNVEILIGRLAKLGIQLALDAEDGLKVSGAKGSIDTDLRRQLVDNRMDLVGWVKARQSALATPARSMPELGKRECGGDIPLSFAQQRLWFLEQLNGVGGSSYCVPSATLIEGALDAQRLARAVHRIVERHEVLRSRYYQKNGQPFQEVLSEFELDSQIIDLTGDYRASSQNGERVLRKCLQAQTGTGFDLSDGRPLRLRIYVLSPERHVLFLSFHHVVFDGWSNSVFLNELAFYYAKAGAPQPVDLPPLPIQYKDYALWQRSWLDSDARKRLLEYWQANLAGWEPLVLPFDSPRTLATGRHGSTYRATLDTSVVEALSAVCRARNTTLFTALLGGFCILLAKYSGQTDILIGTDVAGRSRTQLERLIGFFVNQLVIRCDLRGDPDFGELLERVKTTTLDAYAHQDLPFDALVDSMLHDRDLHRTPFFSVKFIMQNTPQARDNDSELEFSPRPLPFEHARFDMTWSLAQSPAGVDVAIEYNNELFREQTIARYVQHYFHLVGSIAANPSLKITNYPILDAGSIAQARDWNLHSRHPDPGGSLGALLAHHARVSPDATAVVDAGNGVTYEELHAQTNQLANLFASMGVGPESNVGVCLHSSLDYVRTICALSRLGAVFVPIDAKTPGDRVSTIIQAAALDLFVSQSDLLDDLPAYELNFLPVVCLDEADGDWGQFSDDLDATDPHPAQLAYIVFTSGTTGEPKGVMVSGGGINALVHEQRERFEVTSCSRVLQFASIGFDASVWEILMALGNGAALYCAPREETMPGSALTAYLNEHRITHLTVPPSALSVMHAQDVKDLKVLIVAGEACKDDLVRPWHDRVKVFNAYGPSEATVCATIENYPEQSDGFAGSIGRPVLGSRAYIVTPDRMLAGPGVVGELLIGGRLLGRGYWKDAAQTAAAFIPDAFSGHPGERLYRSGDLARCGSDGRIFFIGRIDHQVKIRGFRIELMEIESQMMRDPSVSEGVAIVTGGDNPAILAYVVPSGTHLDVIALRNALRKKLPDYMVPKAISVIDRVPLTANGKLDVDALPKPQLQDDDGGEDDRPLSASERTVTAIWCETLDVEKIGKRSNFFDIGGHSLALITVQEELRNQHGLDVSVADLFKYPSVESLAKFLSSQCDMDQFDGIDERLNKRRQARKGGHLPKKRVEYS